MSHGIYFINEKYLCHFAVFEAVAKEIIGSVISLRIENNQGIADVVYAQGFIEHAVVIGRNGQISLEIFIIQL